jgi:hypothetical protein
MKKRRKHRRRYDEDSFAMPNDTPKVTAEINSRFTRPIKIF